MINILEAAEQGNLDELKELERQGKLDLNQRDADRYTALLIATKRGDLEMVQWLSTGRKELLTQVGNHKSIAPFFATTSSSYEWKCLLEQAHNRGSAPLAIAVAWGHLEVVNYLIFQSETLFERDFYAPHMIDKKFYKKFYKEDYRNWLKTTQPLLSAINSGNIHFKKFTLPNHYNSPITSDEKTLLMFAARWGQKAIVEELLEHKDTNILAVDVDGNTALHFAATYHHADLIKVLCEKGSSTDAANKDGHTPLHLACIEGKEDVVGALLPYSKRHLLTADKENLSPLEHVIKHSHEAAFKKILEAVPNLAEKCREASSSDNNNKKPHQPLLHLLVTYGHIDLLNIYISHAAHRKQIIDLEEQDQKGMTALHLAATLGNGAYINALLSVGANLFSEDLEGNNILHLAVKFRQPNMINWIKDNHPAAFMRMVETRNKQHHTPIELAKALALQGDPVAQRSANILNHLYPEDIPAENKGTALTPLHTPVIRNWVFQGGSIKGIGYIGAIDVIEKKGKEFGIALEYLERVGGASVGSITAMLVGVGYPLKEIRGILNSLDIIKKLDHESADAWMQLKKVYTHLPQDSETIQNAAGDAYRLVKWLAKQYAPSAAVNAVEKTLEVAKQFMPQMLMDNLNGFKNAAIQTAPLVIGFTASEALRDSMKNLAETSGIFPGQEIRDWLDDLIHAKTGLKNATFKELHALRTKNPEIKDLYVVALNLNTNTTEVLSYESERFAEVVVSDALRASMSIPLVFQPWRPRKKQSDGTLIELEDIYVDGGVGDNYPIWLFDAGRYANRAEGEAYFYNHETLGFRLVERELQEEHTKGTSPKATGVDTIFDTLNALLSFITGSRYEGAHARNADQGRTVYIDTCGVGMLDFDINDERKKDLIDSGTNAMDEYLTKHGKKMLQVQLDASLLKAVLLEGARVDVALNKNALNIQRLSLQSLTPEATVRLYESTKSLIDLLEIKETKSNVRRIATYFEYLGIDINKTNQDGHSALALAIKENRSYAFHLLLKSHVNIHLLDTAENSLLDIAAEQKEEAFSVKAILKLIKQGLLTCKRPDKVYELVEQHKNHITNFKKYEPALAAFLKHHYSEAFKGRAVENTQDALKKLRTFYELDQNVTTAPSAQKEKTGVNLANDDNVKELRNYAAIHNLVFAGGSFGGISYAGALEALEKNKEAGIDLSSIKCLGGVSFGSLIALMLAMQYSVEDIKERLERLTLEDLLASEKAKFLEKFNREVNNINGVCERMGSVLANVVNFPSTQGAFSQIGYVASLAKFRQEVSGIANTDSGTFAADKMQQWLEDLISQKKLPKHLTFKQLHEKTGKDLRIVALNISTGRPTTFSYETTPDALVADAVCAALAIPVMYKPVSVRCAGSTGKISHLSGHYVDAHIAEPYPIYLFDEVSSKGHNPHTLGFRLVAPHIKKRYEEGVTATHEVKGTTQLLTRLIEFYYRDFAESEHYRSGNEYRTIYISDRGISSSLLELDVEKKQRLYESGRSAAREFLDKRQLQKTLLSNEATVLAQLMLHAKNAKIFLGHHSMDIENIYLNDLSPEHTYALLTLPGTSASINIKLLKNIGLNLEHRGDDRKTVLHVAIDKKDTDIIGVLLKERVSNSVQFKGLSYLDYAYSQTSGNEESRNRMVELLLCKGYAETHYPKEIRAIAEERHKISPRYELELAIEKLGDALGKQAASPWGQRIGTGSREVNNNNVEQSARK